MVKKTEFNLPTVTLDEEQLTNLISTAMGANCGFDWWKLQNQESYKAARAEILAEMGKDDAELCFEQVWARVLFNGGKLLLLETDSDWHWKGFPEGTILWNAQVRALGTEPEGGTWHEVGLEEIKEGLAKVMHHDGYATVQQLLENGDCYTADAAFQYAAYGDWVFG